MSCLSPQAHRPLLNWLGVEPGLWYFSSLWGVWRADQVENRYSRDVTSGSRAQRKSHLRVGLSRLGFYAHRLGSQPVCWVPKKVSRQSGPDKPLDPEWHREQLAYYVLSWKEPKLQRKEKWHTWSGQNDGDAAAASGMGPGEQAGPTTSLIHAGASCSLAVLKPCNPLEAGCDAR